MLVYTVRQRSNGQSEQMDCFEWKTDLMSLTALIAVCAPASSSTDKSIRSTTQKLQGIAPQITEKIEMCP